MKSDYRVGGALGLALSPRNFAALCDAVAAIVTREAAGPFGGASAILIYANLPAEPACPQTWHRLSSPERWEHLQRALRDMETAGGVVRSKVMDRRSGRWTTQYRPGGAGHG